MIKMIYTGQKPARFQLTKGQVIKTEINPGDVVETNMNPSFFKPFGFYEMTDEAIASIDKKIRSVENAMKSVSEKYDMQIKQIKDKAKVDVESQERAREKALSFHKAQMDAFNTIKKMVSSDSKEQKKDASPKVTKKKDNKKDDKKDNKKAKKKD